MLALCGFEAARLFLGQEDNLHKKISVVFRILVLTVPAQYLTFYFTFWQTKITQVDTILGLILLIGVIHVEEVAITQAQKGSDTCAPVIIKVPVLCPM